MKRAQQLEVVQRINQAYALLRQDTPQGAIIAYLVKQYEISQVQAYRYVQQAKQLSEKLTIPEPSVVFTVKLPPSLITRIKQLAKTQGVSISKTVKTGMEEFIAREEDGSKQTKS